MSTAPYRKSGFFNNKIMNPLLTMLGLAQRGPVVAAYVQQYGSKYGGFVAKEFAALPDPADHPVFLIEPEPAQR